MTMTPNSATPNSDFLRIITERGYMHQATNFEGLDAAAGETCLPAYIGFDCTADSLHVGSLVQIMMLRILQQTGHKPIVLMGGGTTKVGDPSGKDTQRPLLSDHDIEQNKNGIRQVFEKYLKFGDGPSDAIMVDNAEWLDQLEYISFLRNYGMHFSINRMLAMDSVKLRLDREQPMSFLEFNYSILQAYDFMELRRRYGCVLQMGGSDQWGNIVTGVDLTRRVDSQEVFGLTSPLITTASGAKMGKSAQGAIWLNKDKLPVWDFWQFWRNTEDGDIGRFLRLFTELPLDEIARLEALQGSEINDAKIILANEATGLCHSKDEALEVASTAAKAFSEGGTTEGLPEVSISSPDLSVIDALKAAEFAASNGEARRLIRGGGARLNDAQIQDEEQMLSAADFNDQGKAKISSGKKRHVLLSLN
jgi:tyrosyl-tRNA synthetase